MAVLKVISVAVILALTTIVYYNPWIYRSSVTVKLESEYDYVIVGAGSAGSVVASRLSEDGSSTVAVLEAGADDTWRWLHWIPAFALTSLGEYSNWAYNTVPQKHCCENYNNRQPRTQMGKILGGGSGINAMVYIRGCRHDYDTWRDLGARGWGYDDIKPYFLKSEGNQDLKYANSDNHGKDGPLVVSENTGAPEVAETYLKASEEIGLNRADLNDGIGEGVATIDSTMRRGVRMSTATAFLHPAMARTNLHVATEAQATKITFDGKRATGVEYMRDGSVHYVRARKEIILSAGAVGSSKLLLLSGVGPKKHLEELGIPVVADLPVGENLQDHPAFIMHPQYKISRPISVTMDRLESISSKLEYFMYGTGPLSACPLPAASIYRSSSQPRDDKRPYIELLYSSMPGPTKSTWREYAASHNMNTTILEEKYGDIEDGHGLAAYYIMLHPFSRGTVRLASKDPSVDPLIDTNYLADSRDLDHFFEALRTTQELFRTKAMRDIGAEEIRIIDPGCKQHEYDSDDYWRCAIRRNVGNIWHYSSTCTMGNIKDPKTVVDPQLKVKGLSKLRVADLSIIPEQTSGHTNAVAIMIGEKVSDMIRGKMSAKKSSKYTKKKKVPTATLR